VVEGARLESGYTGNCIEGSNPFLSAKHRKAPKGAFLIDAADKACFAKRNQLKKRGTQCRLCDDLSPPNWDRLPAIPGSGQSLLCKAESIKKARHAVLALRCFVSPPQLGSPSGNPWKRAKLALQSGIN
jgi:hypothetical protein